MATSTGAIVGIVILVLIVVALIVFVTVWLFQREEPLLITDVPVTIQNQATGGYLVIAPSINSTTGIVNPLRTNGVASDPTATWTLIQDKTNTNLYTLKNNSSSISTPYINWNATSTNTVTASASTLTTPQTGTTTGWFTLSGVALVSDRSLSAKFLTNAPVPRGFLYSDANSYFDAPVGTSPIGDTLLITRLN